MPVIVSFVGRSESGKTTLIEKLIPVLLRRGLRVGTIKHTHHTPELDRSGKDSARHLAAGASTVVLASSGQIQLVKTGVNGGLGGLVRYFDDVDLLITEGFKQERTPKIEVLRRAVSDRLLCRDDPMLLAVATDATIDLPVPVLPLDDPEAVADFIENRVIKSVCGQCPAGDPGLARLTSWFQRLRRILLRPRPRSRPGLPDESGPHRAGRRRIRAGWPPRRGSPAERSLLAETAGLLHDAGRFEQYLRYRTFRDAQSVHHGRLAVSVIRTHGLLDDFPAHRAASSPARRSPTTTKMRLHPLADPGALFLLKLLRDADKLDILAMAAARVDGRGRHGPLTDLNVPANGSCSPAVVAAIRAGRVVPIAKVRSRCDALLFFLSWVFDLNFPAAFRQLLEAGWFDRLAAAVAPAGGSRAARLQGP